MADMILGGAQGAVDSLLGRLTSALVDEAQLLSGVRSDVQFIKDEMESMNGFLLHIAEADEEDHQVGAWMKQVAEVAYASQNSVDQYIQSIGAGRREPGLLGYLRRLPKLVCTLPRRHRIANQIRELKIRSCEVGERRMRYDVKVPERDRDRANVRKAGWQASGDDDTNGQEDARRRGWVDPYFSPKHCEIDLFRLDHDGQNSLKVIAVVGMGGTGKSHGAGSFYQSHFGRDSFDCKAWICLGQESTEAAAFLGKVLAALDIPSDQFDSEPAQLQPNEEEEMIGQPQPKEKEELIAQLQHNKEEELIAQPEPNEDEELIAQLEELIAPFQRKEKEELIAELQPIEKLKFFRRKEKLKCIAHPQLMETEELIAQLRLHLKDKRYLLVIDDVRDKYLWNHIKSAFPHENCSPGSTILITTRSSDVAKSFSPTETLDLDTGSHVYLRSAMHLMNINNQSDLQPILREIVSKPLPVRLFLRALYVNPNKTRTELQSLCDNLDNSTTLSSNNARQILKFCNLTSNCKNCLLYMSIFPEDTFFERTRLVRRWAAEGMAVKRGRLSVLDEADHCFDLLVAHGFLTPCDMSDTGKVKGCGVDDTILEIITQIAREDHFVKNNHHPDLAHRLSVQYEGQPHQVEKELNVTRSQTCWNICGHQATVEQSNATQEFFESLPSSSHSGNLKVLDLENCNELKDHHLKNICDHAFHLKYLSLRYTNITELPKQIDKLQSLETLDIRETKVKAFAKNSVFLPKLKHLLAGHWTDEELVVNGDVQSKEMFSTVAMPKNIGDMTELQVISHIAVSGDSSELKYVGYLLQLVKLGVIVSGNTTSVLRHLYYATANLGFLRSLSIQVAETEEENENVNRKDASPIYPKFLQKLKISGLKNGLPSWVEKLKVLSKMTLHMTFITDDDFKILGRLISLSWVRLQQESCNETTLTFEKDAFQSLTFLDIKCSAITSINFDDEACPKLKKLAWFSTREQSLSGIECLPRLKELQLTGKFDMQSVKQAIKENKNFICWEAYPTRFRR